MTDEIVTASGRTGISDVERDRAIERLHAALETGRLTITEYADRLATALRAVAATELAGLVADLPARFAGNVGTSAGYPGEVLYLRADGADIRRTGQWRAPARLRVCCTDGDVWLDFTTAIIRGPVVGIEFAVDRGDVTLIVPPGSRVDANRVDTRAGFVACRVPAAGNPDGSDLRFVVAGRQLGGDLVVRYPRRLGPPLW